MLYNYFLLWVTVQIQQSHRTGLLILPEVVDPLAFFPHLLVDFSSPSPGRQPAIWVEGTIVTILV